MSLEKFEDALQSGKHIFLTGAGGTGKSYLIQSALRKYPAVFVVTSSTGISAMSLYEGAKTIHSFSTIGVAKNEDFKTSKELTSFFSHIKFKDENAIKGAKKVILEEVSMISASQLNLIDRVFRLIRRVNKPFGGIQMIFSGDFCLKNGTKITMADGSLLNIEEIEIGDLVMGIDFKPRTVLRLFKGMAPLYKIHQTNGDDYFTTGNHLIALKRRELKLDEYKRYPNIQDNITIKASELEFKSEKFRENFAGYKVGCIDLPERQVNIDPYFLGVWLGDGESGAVRISSPDIEIMDYCKKIADEFELEYKIRRERPDSPCFRISIANSYHSGKKNKILDILREYDLLNNKHIPECFLLNSVKNRLELLAGLLDTDGNWSGNRFSFCATPKVLADQVKQLADQLGFRASLFRNSADTSWIVTIGGDTWRIPTKIKRKKSLPRDLGRSRMTSTLTVSKDVEDYFSGIEVDGDNLFILADGTVTHNCQLSPVSKKGEEKAEFAFQARSWKEANPLVIYLNEVKRTDNKEFAEMLLRIRTITHDINDFKLMKSLENNVLKNQPVLLVATNKRADEENAKQLAIIEGKLETYKGKYRGPKENFREIRDGLLCPHELQLKVGCRIMITANERRYDDGEDKPLAFVNGSMGTYLGMKTCFTNREFDQFERDEETDEILRDSRGRPYIIRDRIAYDVLMIKLDTGKYLELKRMNWTAGGMAYNKDTEKDEFEIEYKQFPVRLAWGITVHKSQGMSLDTVEIDCEGIFADSQFYVAISRARSLEGLRIKNLKGRYIKASMVALEYYKNLG